MNSIMKIVLVLSFVVGTFMVSAQSYNFSTKSKKALKFYKEAESEYKLLNNDAALVYLEKAIKKDENFIEAWLLLGDIYTDLDQKNDAIIAFKKAIQIDPAFFPRSYFFIGNLSFELGKYEISREYLTTYLDFKDEPEIARSLAEMYRLRAQNALKLIQHPVDALPTNIGNQINSLADEYINYVNEDISELVLTRKVEVGIDHQNRKLYEEKFLETKKIGANWSEPGPINLSWSNGLNVGGMNISADGRKMYFTGCNWPNGFGSCDLYVSNKVGLTWEAPINLGTRINSQWWDSQPVISADGHRIYFSSKRNGGKGGSDIWMTIKLDNGKWSPAINLGDSINTTGDEMAPFLHADGNTLYFSSDGHHGLGGYDLFISRRDKLGRWAKAENIGYPVNTKYNEINIFVSIDATIAYISSDMNGGEGGYDIYLLSPFDAIRPEKVYIVKGIVVDKNTTVPVEAKVEVTNLFDGLASCVTVSDSKTGEFLVVLNPEIEYAFNISKPGYLFYSENFKPLISETSISINKTFELEPIAAGNKLILNNVFFDFDQSSLKAKSFTELEKLSRLLFDNESLRIQIEGHTDNVGEDSYNQKLSEDRAQVVFRYLVDKGISPEKLNYKGFGASQPIGNNNTEKGRAENRRTEVKVIE